MKLAFYYHIPVIQKAGKIYIPSYLGVFIDALAKEVEHLYLVLHESSLTQLKELDYELAQQNITWINLGLKTPAWHRTIFCRKILKKKLESIDFCDILLIRSPSPLAPFFKKYLTHTIPCFMIVGDYSESVQNMKNLDFRELIIKYFLKLNNWLFEHQIKNTSVLVNSPLLYRKYEKTAKNIHQIGTTTLTQSDFFERENTCLENEINLLYTGRIDPNKGLFELLEATAILIHNDKLNVKLNIVGWEEDLQKTVEKNLIKKAKELEIESRLVFHGRKKVGNELNRIYRQADIYIIPSYYEGFPRTIWEAMANSLPVIATSVGAIPFYLRHEKNAILIEPKNVVQLVSALMKLITDVGLRKELIINAFKLSQNNTLELQTKKMVGILNDIAYNNS